MPAFLTHFWILNRATGRCGEAAAKQALTRIRPLYLAPGGQSHSISQFAYLGAMGPDWAACNEDGLRRDPAGTIFDLVHRKKSGVLVANLLDAARRTTDRSDAGACLAFTLGCLAHIAGDIMLHPYVNNFAGEYRNQLIKRCFGAAKLGDVSMHTFCEAHMDSYVAGSRYGAGDQMSNGPGDITMASWSDFLEGLVRPGFALLEGVPVIGPVARRWPTRAMGRLVTTYTEAINRTYPGMKASRKQFVIALSNLVEVLDVAYDTAGMHESIRTPPMDWWNLDFVEHRRYRDTWRRLDDLCEAAADVAAGVFWPAALAYLDSSGSAEDRKRFLKAVRDWNLDTGFAIRVYSRDNTIRIRYDSSWAMYLSEKALPRSIRQMNDELMRVARDVARVAGDAGTTREVRQLTTAPGGERAHTYEHDDMDYGLARVRCLAGQVQVTTSAAVWYNYATLGRIAIPAGGEEILELKTMDHKFDQTNRVEVETLSPSSQYEIEFISWDR